MGQFARDERPDVGHHAAAAAGRAPGYHTVERHTIELPPGTSVIAAPEPVAQECAWGRYRCEFKAADGKIVCERDFEMRGRFVPPADFPAFREFWRQCSWCDRAEVVLGTG